MLDQAGQNTAARNYPGLKFMSTLYTNAERNKLLYDEACHRWGPRWQQACAAQAAVESPPASTEGTPVVSSEPAPEGWPSLRHCALGPRRPDLSTCLPTDDPWYWTTNMGLNTLVRWVGGWVGVAGRR